MISDRSLAVLHAIVSDFVRDGEPVGSKSIAQTHDLGVSAATIRNDMAALEDEDLITAPHTSSGRIPTDKGYRLYVDTLANIRPLSSAEKSAIERFLGESLNVEDMMRRTVRVLSNLTNQVAVVQYPVLDSQRVKHLELVQISDDSVLSVLITNAAKVDQQLVRLADLVLTSDELTNLKNMILEAVAGADIHDALSKISDIKSKIRGSETRLKDAYFLILEAIKQQLQFVKTERITVAGAANLLKSGEGGPDVPAMLDALEEQVTLLRLMQELATDQYGLGLSIGEDNRHYGLNGIALMAAQYESSGEQSARLGVLGPTRMDYPRNIAALRAVSRYLGRFLGSF